MNTQERKIAYTVEIYPNPSNGHLTFLYDFPQDTEVTVDIYNTVGVLVKRMPVQLFPAGKHQRQIDIDIAPGLHVVMLRTDTNVYSTRIVISGGK